MDENKRYWTEREEKNIVRRQKEDKAIAKKLGEQLKVALDEVEQEIQSFYARYASKEGMTINDAVKRVSKVDIDKYQRFAADAVKNKDFSETANERMRLYNLTMKVNRLEMLKSRIGIVLTKTYNETEAFLEEKFTEGAYQELKRQSAIMGETIEGNELYVERIVNASYNNAVWSQRLWSNQEALKAELDVILRRGLTQGRNPREYRNQLKNTFGNTRYENERLLITEMARIQTDMALHSYEEMGIDQAIWVTESKPCPLCQALRGKVQTLGDMKYQPPRHPNCRCSVAPYMDRKEFEKRITKR